MLYIFKDYKQNLKNIFDKYNNITCLIKLASKMAYLL